MTSSTSELRRVSLRVEAARALHRARNRHSARWTTIGILMSLLFPRHRSLPLLVLSFAAAFAAASLIAQTPPQTPPAQPPAQTPPPAAPPAAPVQGQVFDSQGQALDPSQQPAPQPGRAGGAAGNRGRGAGTGDVPDFTKQPPLKAKTPEEEIKHIVLQPGY